MTEQTNFDKKEYFEAELLPLLREFIAGCSMNKIPCIVLAAVREFDGETEYHNEIVPPAAVNRNLSNDKIADVIKLAHGYTVSQPIELPPDEAIV